MAAFVFWPARGMHHAATHHIVVLDLQVSFMYFMNTKACDLVFVIISNCRIAQSIGFSSTLHLLLYIMSPSIRKIVALSTTTDIFLIVFSTQDFWTCHRHKKILTSGHTMLCKKNISLRHKIGIRVRERHIWDNEYQRKGSKTMITSKC